MSLVSWALFLKSVLERAFIYFGKHAPFKLVRKFIQTQGL